MGLRSFVGALTTTTMIAVALVASNIGYAGIFDHKKSPEVCRSYTMVEVARMIDSIEDKIRDDGTIVLKRPDVWGQARMSKYRLEFDRAFVPANFPNADGFAQTLQAVIARTDAASFQSESAIAAVLTPATGGRRTPVTLPADQIPATTSALFNSVSSTVGLGSIADDASKSKPQTDLAKVSDSFANLNKTGVAFQSSGLKADGSRDALGVALEPTVVLDEHKRYLDHLNEIRRVNMGDDTADSAGYGLYLFRMPASIQPGECTLSTLR